MGLGIPEDDPTSRANGRLPAVSSSASSMNSPDISPPSAAARSKATSTAARLSRERSTGKRIRCTLEAVLDMQSLQLSRLSQFNLLFGHFLQSPLNKVI